MPRLAQGVHHRAGAAHEMQVIDQNLAAQVSRREYKQRSTVLLALHGNRHRR
jgi:hypothetical protein